MRALTAAIDDPACGGVVLVGGAGFGKTRLAEAAADLAAERRMACASVRATKSGAGIPLAALAPFFTELGVPPDPDADLLRLTTEAIDRRRGDDRLVLVIDDAQELDDASAVLLGQLVGHGGTFIVFTVRWGERESEAIGGMWKDQQIVRIEVGPLPERDLRTLASVAIGGPVEGASLQTLVEGCAGNVLFLRELIQGATESGALGSELGLWRLRGSLAHSPRLRDLVEQRLRGLDRQEREALELVALADPVPLAMLERLVPLEAIELLEERGLLDAPVGDAGPELRLNHPVYGEVVRAHLPSIRRTRLCRALADAVEDEGQVGAIDALRVAVWRLDGGGGGHLETTLAAARTARRTEDYELAIRLGRSAWEQWHSLDAALVLGDALDFAGRSREALDVLEEASCMATTDAERTSLTIRRASALFISFADAEQSERLVDEAMAVVTEPGCRRQLQALLGNNLLMSGDVAKAIALEEALLQGPEDAAFAQASLDVGTGLALSGRTREAVTHTGAALAVRTNLEDEAQLSAVGVYLVGQALALLHAGDLAGAAAISEAGYQVALSKANVHGRAWFSSILGLVYLAQGRARSSVNMFREVATLFRSLDHPGRRWGLGGVALASAQLGEPGLGTAALEELDGLAPTAVHLQDTGIDRGRAWITLVRGDVAAARSVLREAVAQAEAWGQFAAASEALHDLVRMGDDSAADDLERLVPLVDGDFMPGRLAHARALRAGDPDLAAEAADRFERIGAHCLAAEAATLERRLAAAAGLRRRAAAAGARAERHLAGCEGSRVPWLSRSDAVDQLSERERQVAELAAQELTSKDIAERLFVSARTVDNHLQRVYTKLGVAGRGELADRLAATAPGD
jgi:DNA-binding CsgD family transcriptional regulator